MTPANEARRPKPQARRGPRGFTLVEMVATAVVVTIAGSAAMVGVSSTVKDAKLRSERQKLVLDVRAERNMSREKLKALIIEKGTQPGAISYTTANLTVSGTTVTCTPETTAGAKKTVVYEGLDVTLSNGAGANSICLDSAGKPVSGAPSTLEIPGVGRVEAGNVTVFPAGTIEASFGDAKTKKDHGKVDDKAAKKKKKKSELGDVVTDTTGALVNTTTNTVTGLVGGLGL